MSYLSKVVTTSLVNIKLTDKGREFLAKGFKDDNVFDVVKFAFGDSEIDYTQEDVSGSGGADMLLQKINEPINGAVDLKSKLYSSGVIPDGAANVSLTITELNMTTNTSGPSGNVGASTTWLPIDGKYIEEYSWTNLGPLKDYNFGISKSLDTTTATIRTFDTTGSTVIRVKGMTSGKSSLLTLNIS